MNFVRPGYQFKKSTLSSPLLQSSYGLSGLNLIQCWSWKTSVYWNSRLQIGPSCFSSVQSHKETVCGLSAPNVAIYWLSAERSIVFTPFGCGLRKVRTGVADSESHTTSIESSPLSAVTTQRLLSEHAVAVILLQCPCSSFCCFET